MGFFDIADMVAYITKMLHEAYGPDHSPVPELFTDLHHFLLSITHLLPVSVDHIVAMTHAGPFIPAFEDSNLLDVGLCVVYHHARANSLPPGS